MLPNVAPAPRARPAAAFEVLRAGDRAAAAPYTILVVANPALERPWRSGRFVPDPVLEAPDAFARCARYVADVLFGRLPGQAEPALGDPRLAGRVRVVTVAERGLPLGDGAALVAEDPVSRLLVPRRQALAAYARRHARGAGTAVVDVVLAVSASPTHRRASAFHTTDDDARGGVPFTLDGRRLVHRFWPRVPGTAALPVDAASLTALHEFQHAASSYTNGALVDLYVDQGPALAEPGAPPAVNARRGRPVPAVFGRLDATAYASDPRRDGLGYPDDWTSYHCALVDPARPAVMDDYWRADEPLLCQNDQITRAFVRDRILAKAGRPAATLAGGPPAPAPLLGTSTPESDVEPLRPDQKRAILAAAPDAGPEELAEYERLLAERYRHDPDAAEGAVPGTGPFGAAPAPDPAGGAAAARERRLRELHDRLFPPGG